MTRFTSVLGSTVFLSAHFLALPAIANEVQGTFSGAVRSISGANIPGTISDGDPVTGTFSYNTDAATAETRPILLPGGPLSPEATIYRFFDRDATSLSININDSNWASGDDFFVSVVDDFSNTASAPVGLTDSYDQLNLGYGERSPFAPLPKGSATATHPGSAAESSVRIRLTNSDSFGADTNSIVSSADLPDEASDVNLSNATIRGSVSTSDAGRTSPPDYTVRFDVDPDDFSFSGTSPAPSEPVIPDPEPLPMTTANSTPVTTSSNDVFLDFEGGITSAFKRRSIPLSDETYILPTAGSVPAPDLSKKQRAAITLEVQSIFDRSNVDVDVVTAEPDSDGFVKVEFGRPLIGTSLGGLAYDALPIGGRFFPFISEDNLDRFNRRQDARVAVFATDAATPFVAEIAAHEAAHAYGAAHIDAERAGTEVLDYTAADPGTAVLYDEPTSRVTFDDNQEPTDIAGTHNPQFHLRRFADGEAKTDITKTGTSTKLEPGTWDSTTFIQRRVNMLLGTGNNVDAWFLGFEDGSLAAQEATNQFGTVGGSFINVTEAVNPNGVLSFGLGGDVPFTIAGSRNDGSVFDVLLGEVGGTDPGEWLQPGNLGEKDLALFEFDDSSESYDLLRNTPFKVATSNVAPEAVAVAPIPVPASFWLLGSALLFPVVRRRKRLEN